MLATTLHVFTYKAGLLARVAHDLRLRVQRFEITLQRGRAQGYCDATSLVVEGAMNTAGLDPHTPSERDKRQILDTIHSELLLTDRFPRVEFEAEAKLRASLVHVAGSLRLRGQAHPFETELARSSATQWQAAFEITPSRCGIAPYKALGGAIRLQDRVRIVASIELGKLAPADMLESTDLLVLAPAASQP